MDAGRASLTAVFGRSPEQMPNRQFGTQDARLGMTAWRRQQVFHARRGGRSGLRLVGQNQQQIKSTPTSAANGTLFHRYLPPIPETNRTSRPYLHQPIRTSRNRTLGLFQTATCSRFHWLPPLQQGRHLASYVNRCQLFTGFEPTPGIKFRTLEALFQLQDRNSRNVTN